MGQAGMVLMWTPHQRQVGGLAGASCVRLADMASYVAQAMRSLNCMAPARVSSHTCLLGSLMLRQRRRPPDTCASASRSLLHGFLCEGCGCSTLGQQESRWQEGWFSIVPGMLRSRRESWIPVMKVPRRGRLANHVRVCYADLLYGRESRWARAPSLRPRAGRAGCWPRLGAMRVASG